MCRDYQRRLRRRLFAVRGRRLRDFRILFSRLDFLRIFHFLYDRSMQKAHVQSGFCVLRVQNKFNIIREIIVELGTFLSSQRLKAATNGSYLCLRRTEIINRAEIAKLSGF